MDHAIIRPAQSRVNPVFLATQFRPGDGAFGSSPHERRAPARRMPTGSRGLDPSTQARWERGEREPAGTFAKRVERFPDAADSVAVMRRAG